MFKVNDKINLQLALLLVRNAKKYKLPTDKVIELKRNIRTYYKELKSPKNSCLHELFETGETTITKGNYDCTIFNYELYTEPFTREELHEIWKDEQIYSPYDCTGLRFMSGIDQTQLKNGYWLVIKTYNYDI